MILGLPPLSLPLHHQFNNQLRCHARHAPSSRISTEYWPFDALLILPSTPSMGHAMSPISMPSTSNITLISSPVVSHRQCHVVLRSGTLNAARSAARLLGLPPRLGNSSAGIYRGQIRSSPPLAATRSIEFCGEIFSGYRADQMSPRLVGQSPGHRHADAIITDAEELAVASQELISISNTDVTSIPSISISPDARQRPSWSLAYAYATGFTTSLAVICYHASATPFNNGY